ncbi:MAG: hypothetical protein JWP45_2914 [Mucilaginibacter sp.]|nr:hypothetical protein [Mucilaginibacter sp.]
MYKSMLILFLTATSVCGYSQDTIKGKLFLKGNVSSLNGVAVHLKGTPISTVTDAYGEFKLLIPDSLKGRMKITTGLNACNGCEWIFSTKESLGTINLTYVNDWVISVQPVPVLDNFGKGKDDTIPKFPWKPPIYSTFVNLPSGVFKRAKKLGDVDDALSSVLATLKYDSPTYFSVPEGDGFAIVTRVEQIYEDGRSLPTPDRWSAKIKPVEGNWWQKLINSIFNAPEGYYRIIVFVVSDKHFSSSNRIVTQAEAEAWLDKGGNGLPATIRNTKYTSDYFCTALIYEFKKTENQKPILLKPGTLTAVDHLTRSNILSLLTKYE